MSYTKADMRTIFRRGAELGMSWVYDGTTKEAAEELTSALFDYALQPIREEKALGKPNPNRRFDAAKAIEYWRNRGKPSGEGVIPEIAEFWEGK